MLLQYLAKTVPISGYEFDIDLSQFTDQGIVRVGTTSDLSTDLYNPIELTFPSLVDMQSDFTVIVDYYNTEELLLQQGEKGNLSKSLEGKFVLSAVTSLLTLGMSDRVTFIFDMLINSGEFFLNYLAGVVPVNGLKKDTEEDPKEDPNEMKTKVFVCGVLGGRIISISTTEGSVLLGIYWDTPEAIIKLAGIEQDLHLSLDDLIRIYGDKATYKDDYESVEKYLSNKQKKSDESTYLEYRNSLTKKYQTDEYFNRIYDEYKDRYPFLHIGMSADQLPIDVLKTLIDM